MEVGVRGVPEKSTSAVATTSQSLRYCTCKASCCCMAEEYQVIESWVSSSDPATAANSVNRFGLGVRVKVTGLQAYRAESPGVSRVGLSLLPTHDTIYMRSHFTTVGCPLHRLYYSLSISIGRARLCCLTSIVCCNVTCPGTLIRKLVPQSWMRFQRVQLPIVFPCPIVQPTNQP